MSVDISHKYGRKTNRGPAGPWHKVKHCDLAQRGTRNGLVSQCGSLGWSGQSGITETVAELPKGARRCQHCFRTWDDGGET